MRATSNNRSGGSNSSSSSSSEDDNQTSGSRERRDEYLCHDDAVLFLLGDSHQTTEDTTLRVAPASDCKECRPRRAGEHAVRARCCAFAACAAFPVSAHTCSEVCRKPESAGPFASRRGRMARAHLSTHAWLYCRVGGGSTVNNF